MPFPRGTQLGLTAETADGEGQDSSFSLLNRNERREGREALLPFSRGSRIWRSRNPELTAKYAKYAKEEPSGPCLFPAVHNWD